MSNFGYYGESFYIYAMELFSNTGHVVASDPVFVNHSPEQFLYFDNKRDVSLSRDQRAMFRLFSNISWLFSFNGCTFFSINLQTLKSDRSQAARNIHTMIHPCIGATGTVCLFRYDDDVMLSFMGFGLRCILSDWYPVDEDSDELQCRLHISNMSIDPNADYFTDMVYLLARSYYFYPKELPIYELLPITFFSEASHDEIDSDDLKQIVKYELSKPQREYGDDYVEYDETSPSSDADVCADIDLMLLEMDDTDDEIDNPADEDIELEDYEDELSDDSDLVTVRDKYEYEDVDPEIFRDPTLMVKWFQKR